LGSRRSRISRPMRKVRAPSDMGAVNDRETVLKRTVDRECHRKDTT